MVIQLSAVEIRGQSEKGPFAGTLTFTPGLQVISARNAYGKSLVVKAIAWCLGIEPIFGSPDNDPSSFSEAVRSEFEFAEQQSTSVISSECSIRIRHQDGRQLELTRAIKGDSNAIKVVEISPDQTERESNLVARRLTMQDEHGGFQRFLFDWLNWPRERVATYRGLAAYVYLENLVPLFYIDQKEGWANIQALQISRYGQLEIAEVAVEYLLGAIDAVRERFIRQATEQKKSTLRATARTIEEQVSAVFRRRGWHVEWSGHGSIDEIVSRWRARTLRAALKQEAQVDLLLERKSLLDSIDKLRKTLTQEPIDPNIASAPAAASQRVVELKQARHKLNADLSVLRTQQEQAQGLVEILEHRRRTASDLLRLKATGVGRLDHVECPTCHRDVDPETFALTEQSEESVEAHIEALKRDQDLMKRNLSSIEANVTSCRSQLDSVDIDLKEAERALMTVTQAIGTVREQIGQIAAELTRAERAVDRIDEVSDELDVLQSSINDWVAEAAAVAKPTDKTAEIEMLRERFTVALRQYLRALGHSAVNSGNEKSLKLDQQYTPYLGSRRLRALGSASDQPRLVAAYSLALAAASQAVGGLHPGIVVLDEPFQQNPDEEHREYFLTFLSQQLARTQNIQTIIFTWLHADEIERLRESGTQVITPEGEKFLKLVPPKQAEISPEKE